MADRLDNSGNTPAPRDAWEHDGIAHAFDHVCQERDALRAEVSELRADLIRTGAIADREQERGIVLKRQRDEWRDRAESADQVIIEWHEAKAEAIGQHARQYRREGKDDIALRMEAVAATHANSANNLRRGEHRPQAIHDPSTHEADECRICDCTTPCSSGADGDDA
jgi:hypothetical protein